MASSACDACKRRKLKCTSTQPCQRCLHSGVNCTYGSGAARMDAVSYTRHLEAKIMELQALLQSRPTGQPDQPEVEQSQSWARDRMIETIISAEDDQIFLDPHENESGTFHGRFAGLSVLRTVRDLCDEIVGIPAQNYGKLMADAFDCSRISGSSTDLVSYLALLPSREVLQSTIVLALDTVLCCQDFIDREQLQRSVERLYAHDPGDWTTEDRRALALVYSLLALGRQYTTEIDNTEQDKVVLRGVSYFRASRSILDQMDCNRLESIRTILCLTNYLLAASMASQAYTTISVGISAALRLGMHISSSKMKEKFTTHQLTQRRKVFAALNYTQVYLSGVLGMPLLLKDPDPEQTIAVPEEEMYDQGRSLIMREPLSPGSASILVCKLFNIQAEVNKTYELEEIGRRPGERYMQDYGKVSMWEKSLKAWNEGLPQIPSDELTGPVLRTQLNLRFIDSAVKITLYRPFLQHIVRSTLDANFDARGFECGSACLTASMQAIWLANTMDLHNVLSSMQWYVVYNLAIAASSLMLFELGTRNDSTLGDTMAAAAKARELLGKMGNHSLAARRCAQSLEMLQAEIQSSREISRESSRWQSEQPSEAGLESEETPNI